MSDTKNSNDTTLGMPGSKTLTLKRPIEQGTVRQSFSHGRSKAVVVEKVKRRIITPNDAERSAVVAPPRPPDVHQAAESVQVVPPPPVPPAAPPAPAPSPVAGPVAPVAVAASSPPVPVRTASAVASAPASAAKPAGNQQRSQRPHKPAGNIRPTGGMVLRSLTDSELDARANALAESRVRDVEERLAAAENARQRAEEDALRAEEARLSAIRQQEEDVRRHAEEEARRHAQSEVQKRSATAGPAAAAAGSTVGTARRVNVTATTTAPARGTGPAPVRGRAVPVGEDEGIREAPRRSAGPVRPSVPVKPETAVKPKVDDRRRGRLTVNNAMNEGEERGRSIAAYRRRMQRMSGQRQQVAKEKISREVVIPEIITIQELANRMAERAVDVIRLLMREGQMKKITDVIDADTAQLVAEELGHTVKRVAEADVEEGLFDTPDSAETLTPRPPVVTIMGHVDHGKTSLLDAIRQANVVSGEAGGITQHIGAYQVANPKGGRTTFIDTPGHEAFTAMRARGAKATDIVVLVVAADDGVMPQTIEAINHARAANVPIIVAINKIDKPNAKPERVRTELLQYEVQVETLGGETLEVEVSAKQKLNLDKLLDAIQLQAEILDLRANSDRPAEGIVIEAKLDKGRGPVATVLVQRGTLKVGDVVVAGGEWGKVRALLNDHGLPVGQAEPSLPVEILGFNGAPEAGDRLGVVENEARAREITQYRVRQRRENSAARLGTARGSLENMMSQLKVTAGRKEFPLLIKGDVQGSVEAIIQALEKLNTDEVMARIIHAGVGGITESDVSLAAASTAAVIGFNVRAHKEARELAERLGNEIRYYNIIYDLVDDIKAAMSGLLAPERRETFLGNAQILEIFNVSKVGKVAGCRVTDGRVERGANVRLIRDNVVIHEGKLSTLKRFKDEVKEVLVGQECGMAFEAYQDMRAGDVIECYRVEEIKRSL
jgi:translation initiation factor IF-2